MLDSITIKNFKAIQSEEGLTLNNLAQVNYLVGKNGCGKSSVLEGLYEVRCQNQKAGYVFEGNFFRYLKNSKFRESYSNKSTTQISIIYSGIENGLFREQNTDKITSAFKDQNFIPIVEFFNEENLALFNTVDIMKDFESDTELYKLFGEISGITKITKVGSGVQFFTSEDEVFRAKDKITDLVNFSEGKKALLQFVLCIIEATKIQGYKFEQETGETIATNSYPSKFNIKNNSPSIDMIIMLIDEPEKYLHPDYQKFIPKILNFFNDCNIQFIISTHSPFIISAAAEYYDSQKVYLIEKGQTVDLEGNLGQGQDGYSGGECLIASNKMLGAGFSDFVPNAVIFCEGSMAKLINSFISKNKTHKSVLCITSQGDANNLQKNLIFQKIKTNFNTYQKSNIFNSQLKVVIDDNPQIKSLLTEIDPSDLIILKQEEQEKLYPKRLITEKYPDWNLEIAKFKDYLKEKKLTNNEKNIFAKHIGDNITKEEFETFCPELHDLIFN